MNKYAKHFLWALIIILIVMCFSSCRSFKTVTTHTRDTVYVEVKDTLKIPSDTVAIERVHNTVDSVFIEIEKDCPQIKSKIKALKASIKEVCNIESLTGGSIKVWFPELKDSIRINFKVNEGIAYGSGVDKVINDVTVKETVKEVSGFKKFIDSWLTILITICIAGPVFWILGRAKLPV